MYTKLFFRRIYAAVLILAVSLSAINAQPGASQTVINNGQTFYKYTVKAGEGLYAISRNFSVSIDDIKKYNPEVSTGLKVGQEILVPASASLATNVRPQTPDDQNKTFRHTVSRGETVYSIAKMYNTTVEEIYRYNDGARNGITEGQYLIVPQRRVISNEKEENYRYHTILPKETLYSVSRTYSLKPEDVMTANPGLTAETFQIGKIIRIPFFESNEVFVPYERQTTDIKHVVKRGETLYSISKQYELSVEAIQQKNSMLEKGLKNGMELLIPVKKTMLERQNVRAMETQANQLLVQTKQSTSLNVLNVGLLLPFLDKKSDLHLRIQEYYEGFLLAVEKLKNEGVNIDVYVFDIGVNGTKKLESLLGTMEMQSLNLLIGGVSDEQIKVMSDFSKARNIKYVIPFSSKNNEVLNNGNIFQVNTPQSNSYTKASAVFVDLFKNANIIIVSASKNDKSEFISVLQSDMKKQSVQSKSIRLSNDMQSALLPLLVSQKENVIVPSSGDSETLRDLLAALKKIKNEQSDYTLRLFGYPEWQTYAESMQNDYYLFDTYMYTSFFVDESDSETKSFQENFKKWYNRDLMHTYPKYGMLGYDTGLFFMSALRQYGVNFEQNIQRVRANSLQFAFHFERVNNWGGFINTGLYLVRYNSNGAISKIDKSN